mmetsp:Transcript_17198/g.28822  ORF Transcript_17198/g.28822 Transcript_17198/m.28822 type:complete len:132 (-) Transcript_17198:260-655(-)|eukprot:CAMPEP_0119304172 /NCGR_PEP_ID=MMETSP1333-20130426/5468_1 /TAXON_ID=418940 /ORGANISM="Scyphosphaera apsteinii, Strain RCC1455" /LENGTH=131 /DNA_ID=CAMNT_0007307011 /DNA_START=112 /DNA_END=507 /DNA_ORIENTATION=+
MHCGARLGGSISELSKLRSNGARVDAVDEFGQTCLYAAAAEGELQVVNWLITQGADITLINPFDGRSALHAACSVGHALVAVRLLKAGASMTQCDHNGETPAECAAKNGHTDVVRILCNAQFHSDFLSLGD